MQNIARITDNDKEDGREIIIKIKKPEKKGNVFEVHTDSQYIVKSFYLHSECMEFIKKTWGKWKTFKFIDEGDLLNNINKILDIYKKLNSEERGDITEKKKTL